jgi:hypothetical protein
MRKAVLSEKPVRLLKVSYEYPYEGGPAMAEVGKKPSPQQSKIRRRYHAASYIAGEDRHGFDDAEPGDEEPGAGVAPQGVYPGGAEFVMVVLHQATGVEEMG